ncbi:hypothetical protein IWX90DRAFT_248797 [Phyllosticta citrichinensis]|uniref:Uncharacterized protein n=1 Tax=Phyllosticta citrichinensis TaxID=1130410 RepID=A0ABR1XQT2_9PEZI
MQAVAYPAIPLQISVHSGAWENNRAKDRRPGHRQSSMHKQQGASSSLGSTMMSPPSNAQERGATFASSGAVASKGSIESRVSKRQPPYFHDHPAGPQLAGRKQHAKASRRQAGDELKRRGRRSARQRVEQSWQANVDVLGEKSESACVSPSLRHGAMQLVGICHVFAVGRRELGPGCTTPAQSTSSLQPPVLLHSTPIHSTSKPKRPTASPPSTLHAMHIPCGRRVMLDADMAASRSVTAWTANLTGPGLFATRCYIDCRCRPRVRLFWSSASLRIRELTVSCCLWFFLLLFFTIPPTIH